MKLYSLFTAFLLLVVVLFSSSKVLAVDRFNRLKSISASYQKQVTTPKQATFAQKQATTNSISKSIVD